jgi:hypothetical protein
MSKKTLGQFYTTNYNYILQNLKIPTNGCNMIEPFVGNGDLIEFLKENIELREQKKYSIECYDIDSKKKFIEFENSNSNKIQIIKQDTILNPPSYKDKFVITNPPYLARNKSKNKELFDKYDVNDLYKCFIKNIIEDPCNGGIIIIPLNFWCSIRNIDIQLRKSFLDIYNIDLINIFEEKVFNDTSYTICSFLFSKKNNITSSPSTINIHIYPCKKHLNLILNENNNYTFGGEIYNLSKNSKYTINRLVKGDKKSTNILVKCIDDNATNKIGLKIVDDNDIYVDNTPNKSARTYATLNITPKINNTKQKEVVEKFNKLLNDYRDKYHSLFLANYRESKDIARKRISFELVYDIVSHILRE